MAYGEFELDSRAFRALRADKLVRWLYGVWKNHQDFEFIAGSDDESPHVQRFTMARLHALFAAHRLRVIEARGTSLASGPFISHLLGRFESFVRWNAAIVDHLPLSLAAGWMFCLRATPLNQPPGWLAPGREPF